MSLLPEILLTMDEITPDQFYNIRYIPLPVLLPDYPLKSKQFESSLNIETYKLVNCFLCILNSIRAKWYLKDWLQNTVFHEISLNKFSNQQIWFLFALFQFVCY
jgi:hypothetical protein